jgi:hypothetical protein
MRALPYTGSKLIREAAMKSYQFKATIEKVDGIDGAFVEVPYDLPRVFGAGRIKVHARFDGTPYDGSIVAYKHDDGSRYYVIGLRKDIRTALGKHPGDSVEVEFCCAQVDGPASLYYKAYLNKVERKGRTKEELDQAICWLLGYSPANLTAERLEGASFAQWLDEAPAYNPAAGKVKGKVCGVDVAAVEDPTMHRVRVLDKLVDELAKGKPMEKVLPSA